MLRVFDAPEMKQYSSWKTGVQAGPAVSSSTSPDDGKWWLRLTENTYFLTPHWDVDTDAEVYWCIFNFQVDSVITNGTMNLWYDGVASGSLNYVMTVALQDGTPDKAINMELYLVSGLDRTGSALATLTQDFVAGTWYEIAIKVTINSSPKIEVYIDWDEIAAADLTYNIDTGSGDPTPTDGQCCIGTYVNAGGKGDYHVGLGNFVVLDDLGSEFNDYIQIASGGAYNIVAKQPNCDVTGYDEWTPTAGNRNYRMVDDYYDDNPTPGDDISAGSIGDNQLFGLANLTVGGSGTVDAIRYITVYGPNADGVLWVDGENRSEVLLTITGSGALGRANSPDMTTPDGADWTAARLDDLFMGVEANSTSGEQVEYMGVLVLGKDLTKAADNADSDNADCAAPSGPGAAAFVPRVMMY